MAETTRRVTLELAKHFRALANEGLTVNAIAQLTGWSRDAITRAIKKADDAFRYRTIIKPLAAADYQPDNDEERHLALVFDARPLGFPVAFSRPHSRRAA